MKTKFDKETMFSKIKGALEKNTGGGSSAFNDVLKFKAGNTFRLRLVPNLGNPEKTLFHHKVHMWNSRSTGSFISAISLQTFGESDPIANLRWKEYKQWRDANPKADNREYDGGIQQKDQWFIKVRVMDDPVNEDNVGTVKILKMGPQLKEIVDLHLDGVKSKKHGVDIFNPEANIDFVIVAEEQGQYTTFKNSFFEKDGDELTEEELEEMYSNELDMEQIYPARTAEELQQLLEEHYFCNDGEKEERKPLAKTKPKSEAKSKPPVVEDDDDDDDIPFDTPDDEEEDGDIDELLAGLDD